MAAASELGVDWVLHHLKKRSLSSSANFAVGGVLALTQRIGESNACPPIRLSWACADVHWLPIPGVSLACLRNLKRRLRLIT